MMVDWIELAQESDRWRAYFCKYGNELSSSQVHRVSSALIYLCPAMCSVAVTFDICSFHNIWGQCLHNVGYYNVVSIFYGNPDTAPGMYTSRTVNLTPSDLHTPSRRGGVVASRRSQVHPTEIRTSISPFSAVELNTTSALANYTTEAATVIRTSSDPFRDREHPLERRWRTKGSIKGKDPTKKRTTKNHKMFLFEAASCTVLYTGDFRILKGDIKKFKALHSINGKSKTIDTLYLDTTFFTFYGSEYLFRIVANEFDTKVHVSDRAYSFYKCVPEIKDAVTNDPKLSRIHCYDTDELQKVLSGFINKSDDSEIHMKTIKPSAMIFKNNIDETMKLFYSDSDIDRVCYSSHSSFSELKDVILHLKPGKIVPCVQPPYMTTEDWKLAYCIMSRHPFVLPRGGTPPGLLDEKHLAGRGGEPLFLSGSGVCNQGNKYHDIICDGLFATFMEEMKMAAQEESRLAVQEGAVGVDGVSLITVVADGSWAKRSYRSNFSSLSGVGVTRQLFPRNELGVGTPNGRKTSNLTFIAPGGRQHIQHATQFNTGIPTTLYPNTRWFQRSGGVLTVVGRLQLGAFIKRSPEIAHMHFVYGATGDKRTGSSGTSI
uniref:Protein artemis n=1 Tax=Timema shepardi TaxID=629360 RepID=A0A7R9G0X6_TIMSH|nr:unnamed protein product [Timema shepardi]